MLPPSGLGILLQPCNQSQDNVSGSIIDLIEILRITHSYTCNENYSFSSHTVSHSLSVLPTAILRSRYGAFFSIGTDNYGNSM